MRWTIIRHLRNIDLNYTVSHYTIRDRRVLFIDEKTRMEMDLPYDQCSIERVK